MKMMLKTAPNQTGFVKRARGELEDGVPNILKTG
jgi:hypothetical protein